MTKFKNTYRIESARADWWNYNNAGIYFITICTTGRDPFFGKIINGEMHLSDIGEIVENEWLRTPILRPNMDIELGPYVVMPDHFHGIISIGYNGRDALQCVSTTIPEEPTDITETTNSKFGPQSKNLASIIRGFKCTVTVQSRILDPNFGWQSRYYDRIIRNGIAYDQIAQYISDNPKNWNQ